MSLRKLGSETMIYGLSNVLGKMLNFVLVTYFISRLMPREEFGVVGDLMFWTGWTIALLVFRMDTVLFRYASRGEFDARAVYRKVDRFVWLTVGVLLGGAFLFSDEVADWLKYPDRVIYVQLVIVTVAADALSAVPLARLRMRERAWFFVAVNLGNVLINIALIYVLLYFLPANKGWFADNLGLTYNPDYKVGYYLASICIASLLRWFALMVDGAIRYGRKPTEGSILDAPTDGTTPPWQTLISYAAPLTLVAVAGIYNAQSGPTLLKELSEQGSTTENLAYAGLFSAAMKMAIILNLFVTAYNYAAEPFFFRQSGKDIATADRTIYADAFRAYGLIATLAAAGILLFLPWLSLIIDVDYRVGLVILPVLLGANILFGLYANFSIAYKLTDRTWLGGGIALLGSVLIFVINARYTPEINIWAPAWGMLACYALMCVLAYLVSRKYFPVDYPIGRIVLYVLLAVGSTLLAAKLEGADGWVMAGADAGAKWYVRGAVFALLLAAFGGLEHKWIRKTFL